MLHYALTVSYRGTPSRQMKKLVADAVKAAGGLHFAYGERGNKAEKAARAISRCVAVAHVCLTLVREDNRGVWRDGRKSK